MNAESGGVAVCCVIAVEKEYWPTTGRCKYVYLFLNIVLVAAATFCVILEKFSEFLTIAFSELTRSI